MINLLAGVSSFFETQTPIKRIAFFLYLVGGIGCVLFATISFIDGNWINVFTSCSVLLSVIFSLSRFNKYETDVLFGIVSLGSLFALVIGTTFNFGINDAGLQGVYPILVMIGIAFRHKPKGIIIVGSLLVAWVFMLLLLESRGFYTSRREPFDIVSKTIFVAFMIFFMVLMLQVGLQNLLSAHSQLKAANDEALIAISVAEQANRTKSVFLANMSHELRTPLNAIIGYSEMIAEDHVGETRDDAERIKASARKLAEVIGSILEVSNDYSEELGVHLEKVDLNLVFAEISSLMQERFIEHNNQLKFKNDPASEFFVTDLKKLKQILIYLLGNANKYTRDGWVECTTSIHGSELVFAICDNGIGIPAASLDQIFNPFEQVEKDYDRKFEGAGLGLSISQNLAKSMGGSISVESEVHKGSTFYLCLPFDAHVALSRSAAG